MSGPFDNPDSAHERMRMIPIGDIMAPLAMWVREALCRHALDDAKEPINMVINSNGGDVWESFSVMDAMDTARGLLSGKKAKIHGVVHGMCASAAFTILQYCDVRKMTENSILMAHGVTSMFSGDERTYERNKFLLTHVNTRTSRLYAARTGLPAEDWMKILRDEIPTWYTSEEALKHNLVDEVIPNPVIANAV